MTDSEEQSRPSRPTGFADLFSTNPPASQRDTTRDSPKSLTAKSKAQSSDFLATLESMGFKTGEQAFIGTVVGDKYEIQSFLGKGGMSNIFKVRQIQTGQTLALKVLHEHLWQEADSVKRFILEAQAVSRVSHPNIITFQDFGITEEGQPFLVMDYLEGRTLTHAIQEHDGLPLFTVVCVFEQLADGLAAAHKMGVVHRDLKPDNVMFLSNGDDYLLKLVDFGIAKIIAEDAPTNKLTRTGEIFGSPLYMSPEQCLGDKVDQRTDIYSLGAVIYATVTGDPPLYGANVLETMNKQITEMPHPISVIRPDVAEREKDSWVSLEDLEFVVMKCMQKRPYDRYQTMDELLVDVRRLADGTPIPRLTPEQQKQASELAALKDQDALQSARDKARARAIQAEKPYPQFGAPNPVVPPASNPVVHPAPDTVSQALPHATGEQSVTAPNPVTASAISAPGVMSSGALSTSGITKSGALPTAVPKPAAMAATNSQQTNNLRRATQEDLALETTERGRPDKFLVFSIVALVMFVLLAIALAAMSQH